MLELANSLYYTRASNTNKFACTVILKPSCILKYFWRFLFYCLMSWNFINFYYIGYITTSKKIDFIIKLLSAIHWSMKIRWVLSSSAPPTLYWIKMQFLLTLFIANLWLQKVVYYWLYTIRNIVGYWSGNYKIY